jgi:hypothetical protein
MTDSCIACLSTRSTASRYLSNLSPGQRGEGGGREGGEVRGVLVMKQASKSTSTSLMHSQTDHKH